MSLIRKILNVWANSGTVETPAPSAAKRSVGWVGDERPGIDRFNYLQRTVENKINDLATEGVSSALDTATEAEVQAMISTGLWNNSWGCTDDAANIISGGATKQYCDLATFFNADGEPRILVADSSLMKIEVWDPRSRTLVDTSHDLNGDLPGGVAGGFQSLCTDGTWVYATIRDYAATPDDYYIQAWLISDWSVKLGWPATGTKLTSTGNVKYFKAIIANATRIAVVNDATTITANTSPAIEIVDIANGAILASGAGDAPTGISAEADPVIASDGTNVFFGAYGSSSALYLCSATIANPQAGCGGTNWGLTTMVDAHIRAMVSINEKIVSFLSHASITTAGKVILTHTAADAVLDEIARGQDAMTTPAPGSEYIFHTPYDAVYDGVNVWVFVHVGNLSAGRSGALLRIDAAKFGFNSNISKYRCIDDLEPSLFMVMPQTGASGFKPQQGLTFDGRDIWAITEQQASLQNSGKIARLPLALIRS